MTQAHFEAQAPANPPHRQTKLWIYTNYDCNLRCDYCVARSSPRTARRSIGLETVKKLVDEAHNLGFEQVYFTGGEPFLLDEIFAMLEYAAGRLETTVLTNAMLLRGRRLERLATIRSGRLVVQVSLDGSCPEQHDPYRGAGSWERTITGLRNLQAGGFRVRIATTETPANRDHLDALCAFRDALGIAADDHIIRPLARRGFSNAGMEVGKGNLEPELTVDVDGVYWHPLSTDPDLRVSERLFPLADAVHQVQAELSTMGVVEQTELKTFQ